MDKQSYYEKENFTSYHPLVDTYVGYLSFDYLEIQRIMGISNLWAIIQENHYQIIMANTKMTKMNTKTARADDKGMRKDVLFSIKMA